jgi:hypothetical protein
LYRGVWRYTSLDDLMRIVKAVSLSSLVMIVSFTLLFRFEAFPRSVFIIDWFILTVFIAGSRIAVRWFHELPSHEEIMGKRIVIGGTGHVAEALLHRIKKTGGGEPVGIIDDRTDMAGRIVHGLEVLGSFSELPRIVRSHDVQEVILLDSFRDRFPEDRWGELRTMGAAVRVVTDPSKWADDRPSTVHCRGQRVLVAGNGPLVRVAPVSCADAEDLVVASNEANLLAAVEQRIDHAGVTVALYLGALHRMRGIESVLRRHRPTIIVVDSAFAGPPLRDQLAGYAFTTLLPLERIARAASRTSGIRFVAVQRISASADESLRRLVRDASCMVRWIFRDEPRRLGLLECTAGSGEGIVIDAVNELLSGEDGAYRLVSEHPTAGARLEELDIPDPPRDVERVLEGLAARVDGADEQGALAILRDMHETART